MKESKSSEELEQLEPSDSASVKRVLCYLSLAFFGVSLVCPSYMTGTWINPSVPEEPAIGLWCLFFGFLSVPWYANLTGAYVFISLVRNKPSPVFAVLTVLLASSAFFEYSRIHFGYYFWLTALLLISAAVFLPVERHTSVKEDLNQNNPPPDNR